MSWTPKRFWKAASALPTQGGFTIHLDQRPVKTPAKRPLIVPTLQLAEAIADEWDAQQGVIKPQTMPVTRSANSAIDTIAHQFDAVVELIAAYGGTDLLCYRAPTPPELIQLQNAAWDPLLHWSAESLNAPLKSVAGVMHIAQAPASLHRLHDLTAAQTAFQLAAFHDLVALSGSLVLSFATIQGRLTPADAWTISRIDETYQISLWGTDDEAASLTETRRLAFHHAATFWQLSTPN